MVTLISVYFEYIKILCKIFTHHLILFLQIITNTYYIILYYVFILITSNKKFNFKIMFDSKF